MSNFYDVIVIGGGPAGLSAAIYLARARYRVLVVEKEKFGGQITITSEVVNYPGVASGSGEEITAIMRKQAQSFGAEFLIAEVNKVDLQGEEKIVHTSRGELKSFGVIVATGAHPRKIGFTGEEEFKGRGVAYCATCDGEFFTGLDVFVVGGGFAAAEEAVFLTKYARHVTVLVLLDDFTCAKATADLVKNNENITVIYNVSVESVSGNKDLDLLKYKDLTTGNIHEYRPAEGESFGVFVFAGYEPETALVKDIIELDDCGYILTDKNCKTNIEGVYAAGDVCQKHLRQMVTATSDGAIAATEMEKYVATMQRKTGKIPTQPVTRIVQKNTETVLPKSDTENFFTDEVRTQLSSVFEKMQSKVVLRTVLDERDISKELEVFLQELSAMSEKLTLKIERAKNDDELAPYVELLKENGNETGIAFHGVPGGHEFNSFILAVYNVAGPGQTLDETVLERIHSINKPLDIKVLVSLSCTMCPELVMSAQKIAAENSLIKAHVYDLNHFSALRDRYNVMSVPCLVLDDENISFGKKNLSQLLDFIKDHMSK